MNKQEFICKSTGDKYYKIEHSSGLTVYVYPQEDKTTCSAIFGTRYGSIDVSFCCPDGENVTVPNGIAHYLEHKLFENEDSEVFELFAQTGADANAYTTYDKTCYLFNCTEHFEDNLRILLDFVQRPYFTAETVEKERGIIAQEIGMYDDNPDWRVYSEMMNALYADHPVKINIAGTVDSIQKIDENLLYRCYNTFYTPSNMVLSVAGNVDADSVMAIVDEMVTAKADAPARALPEEPETVVKPYVETHFDVSVPLFSIGFKETPKKLSDRELAATEIIMELLSDKPSRLFGKLLSGGLVNHSFSGDFMYWDGAHVSTFSGESTDPEKVRDAILEEIAEMKKNGIPKDDFEWARRAVYGQAVSMLDSTDGMANTLADCHFLGENAFSQVDASALVTIEDVEARLDSMFDGNRCVLSVVKK